jgi:hypothetical protein
MLLKKSKSTKTKIILLSVFIFIMLILSYIANLYVKQKSYKNLWHFITSVGSNYKKSFNADYDKIYIYINKDDFSKLQTQREKFLKQGIITNEGNRYVDAQIIHNNNTIKCKLRLKGHMTDHLQDKKWSFRIKTKGKNALMGMSRLTLQHPGTRAYAYEWIYHQWLKYENIFHLRYFFIKVFVNDEDWGIYALEEHFSEELLHYNKKLTGPILRFNPDMYWHKRINEKNKIIFDEQYASFQSSYIEAYNEDDLLATTEGKNIYNQAIQLLEEFRRKKKSTTDVFDIDKLAKFHAIIDLIGGQHSLDWSDVKYYYNPATNKIEPVGYESFSVNKITQISGANKYLAGKSNYDNFHDMIFSDSAFFSKYIYYLQHFSNKQYLDKFFRTIDPQLQQQLAILYTEFPYKNFDSNVYYQNAEIINKLLNAPASVEAHLQKISNDTLYINVASINALPYLSGSLQIDDTIINPLSAKIIPSKQLNKPTDFITIKYLLNPKLTSEIKTNKRKKIIFQSKLLGTHLYNNIWHVTTILPFTSFQEELTDKIITPISELSFVIEDKSNNAFIIPSGNHIIKQHVIVPQTHRLIIKPGTNITFETNSSLTINNSILCNGNEENFITFKFQDTATQLFIIADNSCKSIFTHCTFTSSANSNISTDAHINIHNTNTEIKSCLFIAMPNTVIHISNSNVSFYSTTFMVLSDDAIKVNYSNLIVANSSFRNIAGKSIEAIGTSLSVNNTYFSGRNTIALSLNHNSYAHVHNTTFSHLNIAIQVVDGSAMYAGNIKFNNIQLGLSTDKKSNAYGNSYIRVKNLEFTEVNKLIKKNKNAFISIIKQIEK